MPPERVVVRSYVYTCIRRSQYLIELDFSNNLWILEQLDIVDY